MSTASATSLEHETLDPAQMHPRVHRAAWALATHGELAARTFAALERCDPLADTLIAWIAQEQVDFELGEAWARFERGEPVPEPARALFEAVANTPAWVDVARLSRPQSPFERGGLFGGLVLGMRSLMAGYAAPAGNKPLAFTGRLRERAPRRVAETLRFVTAVCEPGGMRPGARGWMICLHVRLMHAQVRHLLRASERWDEARWAAPINQHDMLATMVLFSEVYIEGLRRFGFHFDAREREDWIELWRYVAWVMGTEEQLLPRDYAEASALSELFDQTQGPPDEDSRALAAALLAGPRVPQDASLETQLLVGVRAQLAHGLCRLLLGDAQADALGVAPAPLAARLLPALPATIHAYERLRMRVPGLVEPQRELGLRYWRWAERVSLAGKPATYERPNELHGRVS